MEESNTYVGLDVHKDSIDVTLAEKGALGEVRHFGTLAGDLEAMAKLVRKIRRRGGRMECRRGCGGRGAPVPPGRRRCRAANRRRVATGQSVAGTGASRRSHRHTRNVDSAACVHTAFTARTTFAVQVSTATSGYF